MRIVLLGATGMIGQGVLRACLAATDVAEIIVLGRRAPAGINDARLHPVVADLSRFDAADPLFADVDACFFCVGVSSFGMSEQDYRRITHDLTLQVVTELQRRSPRMHLVYVSGAGVDSSERSRTMWARVRGRTENALLALGLPEVAIFRPAMIVPEAGIQSRTRAYRLMYALLRPLLGPLRRLFPDSVLSTAMIGQAMLEVARHGSPQAILAPAQINRLGQPR